MKALGVFRELERNRAHLPSIFEARGVLPADIASKICQYLESGEEVCSFMGYEVDPFDPTSGVTGGASLMTDGHWTWRFDLSYYVKKYRIGLDDAFLLHVLGSSPGNFTVEIDEECANQAMKIYEEAVNRVND